MIEAGPKIAARSSVGEPFRLVDHFGRAVTDETYRGRFCLIFFGFTHCRVVCPRALTKLSRVLDSLGHLAERIQPLYISVDPERDTPEVMRTFLQNYPRFIGLTGTRAEINAAKRTFRVFARRTADPQDEEGYAVPHTAITFLMGPDGEFIAHFTDALAGEEILSRLRRLLS